MVSVPSSSIILTLMGPGGRREVFFDVGPGFRRGAIVPGDAHSQYSNEEFADCCVV